MSDNCAALLEREAFREGVERNCHLFRAFDGQPLLFHVPSGLFLALDDLAFQALSTHFQTSLEGAVPCARPGGEYDEGQLREVLEELAALWQTLEQQSVLPPPWEPRDRPGCFSLMLYGSNACNLACTYCFAHKTRQPHRSQTMSLERMQAAIDFFLQDFARPAREAQVFFVTGGEPLLHFPLYQQVYQYCQQAQEKFGRPVHCGLTTNGTLLTEEHVRFFEEHHTLLALSLDGPPSIQDTQRPFRDGEGTYAPIVERLPWLLRNRNAFLRHTPASTVLTPEYPFPARMVAHLLDLGFENIVVKPTREPLGRPARLQRLQEGYREYAQFLVQRLQEGDVRVLYAVNPDDFFGRFLIRVLLRQKLSYRCEALRRKLYVGPDGGIYPCDFFVGMEEFRVGDIDHGLDPAWQREFLDLYIEEKESCQSCWARYLCGGGCPYIAALTQGRIDQPDPLECELVKFLIELALGVVAALAARDPQLVARLMEHARDPHRRPLRAAPAAAEGAVSVHGSTLS